MNAGTGFACTVHANSAVDALTALVNAALMAGENVGESVVRKVFSASIDLVIHLDRATVGGPEGRLWRQVMEILAVVPSLRDDFSVQPIFHRNRIGEPLEWTGALPPDRLTARLSRTLPDNCSLADLLSGAMEAI